MSPKVDIVIYAGESSPQRVAGCAAAVIDVFRATSVIINALHNGAKRVIPAVTIEEALEIGERFAGQKTIMGGERDTVRISGFDKGNSPLEYTPEDVKDSTIIFSTTNGTRAIMNSREASPLLIASFINMKAACRELAAGRRDAVLVCSGREDTFTAEDGLCAGAMAEILSRDHGYRMTDIAGVLAGYYSPARGDLKKALSSTRHYNFILGKGYHDDIDFCLQRDIYTDVPVYDPATGCITLKR